MEVSIRGSKSDGSYGIRLPPFFPLILLFVCLGFIALSASNAHGFSLRSTGGSLERVRPGDLLQDGGGIGGAAEQTFDQGSIQSSLVDIAAPVELSLGGGAIGSLGANIVADRAFEIRLTRQERRDCLTDLDFNIQLQIISPLESQSASGGQLGVARFEPELQSRRGGGRGRGPRCSNRLRFGYELDLVLDDAIAAGVYRGVAEITVTGPTGDTDTVQIPIRVEMPGLLMLYYYSQINVDLQAAALASALGANSSCSGGFCMGVGNRTLTVGQLDEPVVMDIGAFAPTFNPIQTITLNNAVGVRATGCSGDVFDSARYQVFSDGSGIRQTQGAISIAAIANQPCGLDMRTGDLSFELDLTQVDGATARASATIEITITGL